MADSGWPWVGLVDVADLRLSSVDKKITPGENKVRLCNYSDVYNHSVLCADMDYMEATATEREIQNCHLEVGDVIITKDSETPDDIGVPAVVREKIPDLVCGYHLAILRPVKSALDGEYLNYALGMENAKRQFQMYANGITRFGLRAGDIKRVGILLPPLPDQRKIAAILSSVDDAIEKTQAVIDQVQVVKRGLMQELFTRGLPGRHTRFKQTAIGEIPEDWVVDKIGQLGQKGKPAVKAGPFGSSLRKYYYVSEGYRVYGQEQVLAGDLSIGDYYIDEERFESLRSCEVRAGDILVSLVGTFGKAMVVPANAEPGIINPRLLRLSLDPQLVLPEFFCFWLRNGGTQKLLADAAQGGTMGVLNAGIVKSLLLGRPSLPEQAEIIAIVAAVERRLHREAAMNAAAVRSKTALMSVLLTGELRVTPDAEPA